MAYLNIKQLKVPFLSISIVLLLLNLPLLAEASFDAANDTKIIYYKYSFGTFASEYAYVCDAIAPRSVMWEHALRGCEMLGDGWALATFPTIAALNGLRAAIAKPVRSQPDAWVGGFYNQSINAWQWAAGRLKNKLLYQNEACVPAVIDNTTLSNCPWSSSYPTSVSSANCAILSGGLLMGMGNTECDKLTPCFVCERSSCLVNIDCFGANTASVDGYQPRCNCKCKSGTWGARCEFPISIDHGLYTSEYVRMCDGGSGRSWTSANASCSQLGAGWALATFPTANSFNVYRASQESLGIEQVNAWISAADLDASQTWRWLSGRVRGQAFWQMVSSTPTTFPVVPVALPRTRLSSVGLWAVGQPTSLATNLCGQLWAGSSDNSGHLGTNDCNQPNSCYISERSPCKLGTDCYEPNTASMIPGYYPHCACTCKSGAWGDRCQWPIVVANGPYTSEYQVVCDGTDRTMLESQQACSTIGNGEWSLASFPTSTSLSALQSNALLIASMWIGASETSAGLWSWTNGRLATEPFFNAALAPSCIIIEYYSAGAPVSQCIMFVAGQPLTNSLLGCGALTKDSTYQAEDFLCESKLSCYACERSPCQLGIDCLEPNTLQMSGDYYPSCTCTCKSGASGSRCEWPLKVDQGPYVSEYSRICDTTPVISITGAVGRCASLGAEWFVATFPTQNAFQQYRKAIGGVRSYERLNTWLAASDATTEGQWLWTAGRLSGLQFYGNGMCITYNYTATALFPNSATFLFCGWRIGQPDNYEGFQNCAEMWQDGYMEMDDSACSAVYPCVACERTLCKIGTDCFAPNTASVSGYYPNCACSCIAGASGTSCQRSPLIIDHGPYTSEYFHVCDGTSRDWPTARAACSAAGTGFGLATFPTAKSLKLYQSSLNVAEYASTQIGAYATDMLAWTWVEGRLKNFNFFTGVFATGTCNSLAYPSYTNPKVFNDCLFTGQPDASGQCLYLWGLALMSMDDYFCTLAYPCYACERSPCRMSTDCYEPNTASMPQSYYPNCVCTCKAGASGTKCEWPITIEYGAYATEYQHVCGTLRPYDTAGDACTTLGTGWNLATFPTLNTLSRYKTSLTWITPQNTWIAAKRTSEPNTWTWTAGRLNGITFFTGTGASGTCLSYVTPSFTNQTTFSQCIWAPGQPDTIATQCGYLWTITNMFMDDTACENAFPCSACERSACRLGTDCYEPGTASMSSYYPCTCACKSGWQGAKCRYLISVDHGPYTSEYEQTCESKLWTEAQTACTNKGTGWNLATLPTPNSLNQIKLALMGFTSIDAWLAGSDSAISNRWVWTQGRLKDINFWNSGICLNYTYPNFYSNTVPFDHCQWNTLQPDDVAGLQNCATIWSGGDRGMDDFSCTAALGCYVCERSPCKLGADCYEPNTASMIPGYYPNCACTCRSGTWGDRCQWPMQIDQGPYLSIITHGCDGNPRTWDTGNMSCGGSLATFPTAEGLWKFRQFVSKPFETSTIIGVIGSPDGLWRWSGGRLVNANFWTGSAASGGCITVYLPSFLPAPQLFRHCPWETGHPTDLSGGCGYLWAENDAAGRPVVEQSNCARGGAQCYACESSPCNYTVDCYLPNTKNMTGDNYPNCHCQCKEGAWGPKCEWPLVVDNGPYVSEYEYVCDGSGRTQAEAQTACELRGEGWSLATFPTDDSFRLFRRQLMHFPVGGAWIGATDSFSEGDWVWSTGRLKMLPFFHGQSIGGNCLNSSFESPDGAHHFFNQCQWALTQPQGLTVDSDCAFLWPTGKWRPADGQCGSKLQCIACERSQCASINIDCNVNNTVQHNIGNYYPNCCVCSKGWKGHACRIEMTKSATVGLSRSASKVSSLTLVAASTITTSFSTSSSSSVSISANESGTRPVSMTESHFFKTDSEATQQTLSAEKSYTQRSSTSHTVESTQSVLYPTKTRDSSDSLSQPCSRSLPATATKAQQITLSTHIKVSPTVSSMIFSQSAKDTPSEVFLKSLSRTMETTSKTRAITPSIELFLSLSHVNGATQSAQLIGSITNAPTLTLSTLTSASKIGSKSSSSPKTISGSPIEGASTSTEQEETLSLEKDITSDNQSFASLTVGRVSHSAVVGTPTEVPPTSATNYGTQSLTTVGRDSSSSIKGASVTATKISRSSTHVERNTATQGLAKQTTDQTAVSLTSTQILSSSATLHKGFFESRSISNAEEEANTGGAPINVVENDEMLANALHFAASPQLIEITRTSHNYCNQLELTLVRSSILVPLSFGITTYDEVILRGIIILAVALVLGIGTVLMIQMFDTVARRSFDPNKNKRSTVRARFPATAIQCFIFLSQGLAVAVGLSLGTDSILSIVWGIAIVLAPAVCTGFVRAMRSDPFHVISASLDNQEDFDYSSKNKETPSGWTLLCGIVKPRDEAKQLGPLVGDLKYHHILTPCLPTILPIGLLAGSLISKYLLDDCEKVPLVSGIVLAAYSLLVIVLRPYLSLLHTFAEVVVSAASAVCLILWEKRKCQLGVSSVGYHLQLPIFIYFGKSIRCHPPCSDTSTVHEEEERSVAGI